MSPSPVDQAVQALDLVGAVVELAELGRAVLAAGRDLVEDVLHAGGELVGDLARSKCSSSRRVTENASHAGTSAVPFL